MKIHQIAQLKPLSNSAYLRYSENWFDLYCLVDWLTVYDLFSIKLLYPSVLMLNCISLQRLVIIGQSVQVLTSRLRNYSYLLIKITGLHKLVWRAHVNLSGNPNTVQLVVSQKYHSKILWGVCSSMYTTSNENLWRFI